MKLISYLKFTDQFLAYTHRGKYILDFLLVSCFTCGVELLESQCYMNKYKTKVSMVSFCARLSGSRKIYVRKYGPQH